MHGFGAQTRILFYGLVATGMLLGVSGCASSAKRHAYLEGISSRGVDAAVAAKMKENKALDVRDIEHLVERSVPDETILAYLREKNTVYVLKVRDIDRLRKANASDRLIDFLLDTPNRYGAQRDYRYRSAYYYSSLYHGYGFYPFGYRFHPRIHGHHHRARKARGGP